VHLQSLPLPGKADLPRGEQAATGPEAVFTGFWKAESPTCLLIIWTEGKLRQRGNCGKVGAFVRAARMGHFNYRKWVLIAYCVGRVVKSTILDVKLRGGDLVL
jgi:hypothetical protein